MTEKLTMIEKALLEEFESLAVEFEALVKTQSQHFGTCSDQIKMLAERQTKLEAHLSKVSAALDRQNRLTTDLIEKARHLSGRPR